jgi:sarcosine oxidase subunit delta
MLKLTCPVCGVEGDETDFHYGHEAHIARPATHDPDNVSGAMQRDYLFMRRNPRGLHFERWRCDRGCGKWFHAARDTMTMEFRAFYLITGMPPEPLQREAKGEWADFFGSRVDARSSRAGDDSPPYPSPQAGED